MSMNMRRSWTATVAPSFDRPLASRQIHREEDVEFNQGSKYEKDGVHAKTRAPHFLVQLETVTGKRNVQ